MQSITTRTDNALDETAFGSWYAVTSIAVPSL